MAQRIVIVTGVTGNLGRVVAASFRAAGETVAGIARSGGEFKADLTDEGQTVSTIGEILGRYGRIDVLVHAMGGFAGGEPLAETGLDVWNRMMAINFHSALYVCRSVVPHMIQTGSGRIVAVGSRVGVQAEAKLSAYGASKAALNSLIQTIAIEVKTHGVTANVVLPSTMDTEANRAWGSAGQIANWVRPESVAGVILWLASEAAADVNGALIPVYGRA
jgi:NAD(P)-dependent dehydrogenase (short-subunit alcohol dehydrogenase family)